MAKATAPSRFRRALGGAEQAFARPREGCASVASRPRPPRIKRTNPRPARRLFASLMLHATAAFPAVLHARGKPSFRGLKGVADRCSWTPVLTMSRGAIFLAQSRPSMGARSVFGAILLQRSRYPTGLSLLEFVDCSPVRIRISKNVALKSGVRKFIQ